MCAKIVDNSDLAHYKLLTQRVSCGRSEKILKAAAWQRAFIDYGLCPVQKVLRLIPLNCIIVVIIEFKREKQSQYFNFVGMTKRNVFVARLTQVTPAKVSSVFEENCG